ncbi:MAG: hypothetical protein KGJ98_08700 [Chloroflexota bacterium]|nr:hypothetical protein [Chloroflexota bacterium]MDE3102300.1 hypothetical protein [Chloroflexota bacterium]
MNDRRAAALSFQYALIIFVLTALLGLANATKLFGELDQNTLLTHLHSGTLGWITLGTIGLVLWLFGGTSALVRPIVLSAAVTGLYVAAFWSGSLWARLIFGAVEVLMLFGWWWWTLRRSLTEGLGRISVPKLSVLLGLTTVVIGGIVGVIVEIEQATGNASAQTGALIGTHAGAQVAGYLVLVAAGVIEWQLAKSDTPTIAGRVEVVLLFLAGLAIALGSMLNLLPLDILSNALQTAAVVMIVVRLGGATVRTSWTSTGGRRHVAIVVPYLVVSVVLFIVLVQDVGQAGGDIEKVPQGLVHALDHTMFIGVMTNALFGMILVLLADRPRVWPWADQLIFWGLNIGAASFIAVLSFVGTSEGTAPFAHPVAYTASLMGLAVLLAIATFTRRLQERPTDVPAPAT